MRIVIVCDMEDSDRPSNGTRKHAHSLGQSRLVPRISSRELMRHHPELIIEHAGREYRLRVTQSGKLILTA